MVLVMDEMKILGITGDRGHGSNQGSGAVWGKQSGETRRNRTGHALINFGFRFLFNFQQMGIVHGI